MDKDEYFVEENVAEILHRPAPKETLKNNLSPFKTKNRKRKNSNSDSAKTKIPNTTTSLNFTASDENSDKECFVNRLPADLLSRIIEFFPIKLWPKMELVSRQFQAATFCAWRNLRGIDFKSIDDKFRLDDGKKLKGRRKLKVFLQKLSARSPLISSISGFDNYVYRFDKSIIISVTNFDRLRIVKFSNLNFTPELFKLFFSSLKNSNLLIDLNLTHVRFLRLPEKIGSITDDECMIQIFRDTPMKLEAFSYKHNVGWKGDFLKFIDVSNLQKLSLASSALNYDRAAEFFSRCTELRKLNIAGLSLLDQKLVVSACGRRGEILSSVAKNCPKLETLKIRDTRSRLELFDAFAHMVNLRRFEFTPAHDGNVSCEMFTILTNFSLNLTYLRVSGWLDRNEPQLHKALSELKKLQYLHLSTPVNGSMVEAIASNLHDLRTLVLGIGVYVSHWGALHSLCALEKLQKLTLYQGASYRRLSYSLFAGTENKTLNAWAAGGLLNRLKVLQLSGFTTVSDAGLSSMVKYGSENLQRLQLTESAITVVGVRAILGAFTHLRELDVRNCRRVDLRGLEQIEKLYENVKIYKGDD